MSSWSNMSLEIIVIRQILKSICYGQRMLEFINIDFGLIYTQNRNFQAFMNADKGISIKSSLQSADLESVINR